MVKRKDEINTIKKATKIAKEIINSVEISKGMTENEIRKQLIMNALGKSLEPSYEPIVASGINTAVPHHRCTNKKIEGFVLIDFGVRVGHYCSDITRCFAVSGTKAAEREIGLYRKMHDVFDLIIDEIPSMETGKEIAVFSEKVMKRKGLPEMIHAVGHGIGLDVHEFPRMSRKYEDKIAGTVFTIEPATYYGTYGARFEEVVYYDGKKVRIL
jgi:Xaa-Pro aminopeptidase